MEDFENNLALAIERVRNKNAADRRHDAETFLKQTGLSTDDPLISEYRDILEMDLQEVAIHPTRMRHENGKT